MRADIKAALDKNKEVNKFYSVFGFKKMIKGIEKYLKEDEIVKYIRDVNVKMNQIGDLKPNAFSIKGKEPVIIVVTDKRVLIYQKMLVEEKLEQVPVEEIRSYDFNKGIASSKLRITSLTKSVDIDLTCEIEEVKLLNDVLEEVTTKAKPNSSNSTLNMDISKLLRDLADLKKDGIITNEEFEKKKSELLAKI